MIKGNPYVKNGWLRCPACKRKLFPVRPDTKIRCLLWVVTLGALALAVLTGVLGHWGL